MSSNQQSNINEREFTREEVAKHLSPASLWAVHDNGVYDVTEFSKIHPGGFDIMLEAIRKHKDLRVLMRSAPHKHSKNAYGILKRYRIGHIVESEQLKFDENSMNPSVWTGNVEGKIKDGVTFFDWTQDKSVDWSKALFWQIDKLGASYYEWISVPIDRRLRLFTWNFIEALTYTPWWSVPVVWLPVVVVSLIYGVNMLLDPSTSLEHRLLSPWLRFLGGDLELQLTHVPFLFTFGILLWTLLEYLIHRFIFHLYPPAEAPWRIRLHFILHGQHHKAPFDPFRLVFPPVPAALIIAGLILIFSPLFGRNAIILVASGGIFGYVCYDMIHYFNHHGGQQFKRFGFNWLHLYLDDMKAYHMLHHFERSGHGYGISSKLWDYVFRTVVYDTGDMIVPIADQLLNHAPSEHDSATKKHI